MPPVKHTGKEGRFNVAASIKMRKSNEDFAGLVNDFMLQCGRIYKDAEIRVPDGVVRSEKAGFNVAASIKMRKSFHSRLLLARGKARFNVAASIKMRKSLVSSFLTREFT